MNNEIMITTKVSAINQVDLKAKILELLRWAHNRMRIKIDSDMSAMLVFDAQEISCDLQTIPEFKTLKLPQIREAFQKGLSGGYGEFFGLNCVTYAKWIRAYLSEQKTANGQIEHELVKLRLAEEKPLSQKELDEISEANFKFVLDHFKKTGEVKDYGGACFLYLWRIKKLRFDDEKSKEYIRRAEQIEHMRLTEELENAKAKLDKIAKNQIETELDELLEGKKTVNTIARELALADYLLTL